MAIDYSVRKRRETVCMFMMMLDTRHCTGIHDENWDIHVSYISYIFLGSPIFFDLCQNLTVQREDCKHHKMLIQKLLQQWLKLLCCWWQGLVIMYCHQCHPIYIFCPHSDDCSVIFLSSLWTFCTYDFHACRLVLGVFHLCVTVFAFFILAFSTLTNSYLRFLYLHFQSPCAK